MRVLILRPLPGRCAALGYGQIHVINSSSGKYKQSARASQGAEKWLDVHVWMDIGACIEHARRQGRQILVTHFDDTAIPISVRFGAHRLSDIEFRAILMDVHVCSGHIHFPSRLNFAQMAN